MKNKGMTSLIVLTLISLLLGACTTPQPASVEQSVTVEPSATMDIQATIDAGIASTSTAQAMMQEAIDQAVVATITAMPTPEMPASEELSEEELAQMIDEAVNEALYYSNEVESATTSSTSDDVLTEDELEMLMSYYGVSQSEIEYALMLAEMYLELYYELGEETVDLLYIVVEDLEDLYAMSEDAMELVYVLENVAANGGAITAEDIAAVIEYSQQFEDIKPMLEDLSGEWLTALQGDLTTRADEYLQLQADQVAGNRIEALAMAGDYITSVRSALGDGVLSNSELNGIAQMGANVGASFNALNLPNNSTISGSINDITGNLARGQIPQASANIGQLEGLIGRR
ncbi:MAG: hypothetical protein JEZ00_09080 [Anaerolineaceae bacterium]|nr:hypothetical protein [Anaerolineaceae bacterium]